MGDVAGVQVASNSYLVRSFDDDGDLKLDVGQGATKQTFVVCSRALSRASRPFKAMLYGPFAESKPSDQKAAADWTVALPDDDQDALAILLYIVHGTFDKVPQLVDRGQLFRITVLTDKYDMTHNLRPWSQGWIRPFTQRRIGRKGDEYLLWIAYVLGDKELFLNVQRYVYDGFSLDEEGNMLCPFGCRLDDSVYVSRVADLGKSSCHPLGPRGILARLTLTHADALERLRAKTVEQLLGCIEAMMSRLAVIEDPDSICKLRRLLHEKQEPLESQECRSFYLGSLVKALSAAGYFPVPSASDVGCSLDQLRVDLKSVCAKMQKMKSLSGHGDTKHKECSPAIELRNSLDAVSGNLALAEGRIRDLSLQAKKSGLE